MMNKLFNTTSQFNWRTARDYLVIFMGALIQALALRIFLVPSLVGWLNLLITILIGRLV